MTRLIGIFLITCSLTAGYSQDSVNHKRLKPLLIGSSIAYAASVTALSTIWYDDFESFHFFNDNAEWLQIDKVGHFYATFQLTASGKRMLKWAGVQQDKALLYSTIFGAAALLPVEVLDGFSSNYGASYGDILANASGAMFFFWQQKLWQQVRVHPKFSFNQSPYAKLRPELLGANFTENIIKDYNGQTYWLSIDLSRFNSRLPKWLNIAVGYGGRNMVYARKKNNIQNGYYPQREFYLAIDFDLSNYQSHSALVNTLIYLVNMVHLPGPTLAYSDKLEFHLLR